MGILLVGFFSSYPWRCGKKLFFFSQGGGLASCPKYVFLLIIFNFLRVTYCCRCKFESHHIHCVQCIHVWPIGKWTFLFWFWTKTATVAKVGKGQKLMAMIENALLQLRCLPRNSCRNLKMEGAKKTRRRTRTSGSNPDARLWLITRYFLSRNSALICAPIPPFLCRLTFLSLSFEPNTS